MKIFHLNCDKLSSGGPRCFSWRARFGPQTTICPPLLKASPHDTSCDANRAKQEPAERGGVNVGGVECGRGLNVDFNWMLAVSVECRTGSYIFVIVKFYV